MSKIKYIREAGYIYDLLSAFYISLNREQYLNETCFGSDADKDIIKFVDDIISEFSPISRDFEIFFSIGPEQKVTYMTKNYYKPNIGEFIEGYDFNKLMEDIGDHDRFVAGVIDYYFPNADKDKYFKNRESMMYIGKIIEKSGLGSNIKSELFSFFIDPDEYIGRFKAVLAEKEAVLREYYNRNSYKIDEWLQRYDSNEFFDELAFMIGSLDDSRTTMAQNMLSAVAGYSVGICLVNRYHVCVYQCSEANENNTVLMLGCNYKDGLEYEMSVYDSIGLNGLGEVFSEPNRIAILDYMFKKDESSIKDIERELDISGSTAYYHLSIMLRNKMVRSRVKGRTVMYSINHEYFGYVSKLLGKYSEKKA